MIGRDKGESLSLPFENSGSPNSGEPVFLAVGILGRTHGLHGDLTMRVMTDFPERLEKGRIVYVGPDYQAVKIRSVRWHQKKLLISFEGVDEVEQAALYRNRTVFVSTEDLPSLPDGEFYHHQIIGLDVFVESGERLGEVVEIIETGANDVYVVRPEKGKDILLPATDEVVLDVNLSSKKLKIHLLPGLLPD